MMKILKMIRIMSDNDEIIMFISRDDHDFVSVDVVEKDHEN